MNDRFGLELAIDLRTLRGMIEALKLVLPEPAGEEGSAQDGSGGRRAAGSGGGRSAGAPRRGGGGLQSVESRDDAIKALQMICAYLERSEPTNPAQLLLRRASG